MVDITTFQAIAPAVFDAFGGIAGGVIRPVLLEQQGRQTVAEDGVTITADTASETSRAFIYDASFSDAQLYGVEVGSSIALIPPTELTLTPRLNDKLTATDNNEIWFLAVAGDPTGAKSLWVLSLSKVRFKQ